MFDSLNICYYYFFNSTVIKLFLKNTSFTFTLAHRQPWNYILRFLYLYLLSVGSQDVTIVNVNMTRPYRYLLVHQDGAFIDCHYCQQKKLLIAEFTSKVVTKLNIKCEETYIVKTILNEF